MAEALAAPIHVEVVYALPHEQTVMAITVPADCQLRQAIERSGILERHPEIDLAHNKVGIFGKMAKLDATPRDGDRIEIYRPLLADPKEVRRQRAAENKPMKKGGSHA